MARDGPRSFGSQERLELCDRGRDEPRTRLRGRSGRDRPAPGGRRSGGRPVVSVLRREHSSRHTGGSIASRAPGRAASSRGDGGDARGETKRFGPVPPARAPGCGGGVPVERTGYHLILGAALLAEFAALLTLFHFWDRYADPVAALLLPWAAIGIVFVATLLQRAFARVAPARRVVVAWALFFAIGVPWFASTVLELQRDRVDPSSFGMLGRGSLRTRRAARSSWRSTRSPPITPALSGARCRTRTVRWRCGTLPPARPTSSSGRLRRPAVPAVLGTAAGIPDRRARPVFDEHRGAETIVAYRWSPATRARRAARALACFSPRPGASAAAPLCTSVRRAADLRSLLIWLSIQISHPSTPEHLHSQA